MKRLLKLSLIASFLGVLLLLFLANHQKPREISSASNLTLNEKVKISGLITEEKNYGDFSILTLQDELGKIAITCNCGGFKNKTVEVQGKITEYKNTKQIQAEQIHLAN